MSVFVHESGIVPGGPWRSVEDIYARLRSYAGSRDLGETREVAWRWPRWGDGMPKVVRSGVP